MRDYAGMFFGDAPQFIILSLLGAFIVGYVNFAYRLMADVDPRDKGFFELQIKRIRFNDVFLGLSFLLTIFRIIYCNFVKKEIFPEIYLRLIDLIILLLIIVVLIMAKNFFRDGLYYIKTYGKV